jgi:decaprenylphospho-beta-D-ribofuranose 2-oxidase
MIRNRHDPSNALPGIECREGKVGCYTHLYEERAWILAPDSVEQLRQIFDYARESDRRVTMRGGGHSFDAQPIGDDLVVSTEKLNSIELLDGDRVRVGPGAKWGEIFAATEPHGLIPAITVTTENATAGGTLSADCLSRFSPAYGKEGTRIESFDLLTTEGELLQCSAAPPETSWDQLTQEQRAFRGVIGGFGYLGAVVSITYRLLSVGETGGQIGVRTFARTYEGGYDRLVRDLLPATQTTYEEESDPNDPGKLDAIWSGLVTSRGGRKRTFLFTSAFTPKPERRKLVLHRPKFLPRIPYEWLMRVRWTSRLLWSIAFRIGFHKEEYIDDVEGFTFFMDGNARAKRVGKRLGFSMRNIQQTFVVPFDPDGGKGWQDGHDLLVDWLDTAQRLLDARDLSPTLQDVLFLPADEPFLLSSTAGGPGFAASYAFETSSRSTLEKASETFSDLADIAWESFGGRVHLVKNVVAKQSTLAEMYREGAARFFELKRELDPAGILRNDFLERNFGELFPAGAAAPVAETGDR